MCYIEEEYKDKQTKCKQKSRQIKYVEMENQGKSFFIEFYKGYTLNSS